MARKINLSGVKEFLFHHGEKVALGACGFIALLLGIWGILAATGAGRPGGKTYAELIQAKSRDIKTGMDRAQPTADAAKPIDGRWLPVTSNHQWNDLINLPELGGDKRRNPMVLAIKTDEANVQMTYIAGLTYQYDKGTEKRVVYGLEAGAAAGGGGFVPPMPPVGPGPKGPRETGGAGGAGAGTIYPFVHVGVPTRMVVVHARFPMKQQVVDWCKALNLTQQELFNANREDLPKPVGIDVYRFEIMPDGKPAEKPVVIMGLEADGFKINAKLDEVLRQSIYDEQSPKALEEWIWSGLTMPMPKLGNRQYPKFKFEGFDVDWAFVDEADKRDNQMAGPGPGPGPRGGVGPGPLPGSGLPGFGNKGKNKPPSPPPIGQPPGDMKVAAVEYNIKENKEKDLNVAHPGLIDRLFIRKPKNVEQDLNVYHVLGRFPTDLWKDNKGPGGLFQGGLNNFQDQYFDAWQIKGGGEVGPGGPGPIGPGPIGPGPIGPGLGKPGLEGGKKGGPGSLMPETPQFPNWDRDALVRFIDVDVKPGKTYYYVVRARFENPNFQKPKLVAFEALAANRELPPSAWSETPRIPIPEEYHLFAVDQKLQDDWAEEKAQPKKQPSIVMSPTFVNHYTPLQIHQWSEIPVQVGMPGIKFTIGDWVIGERVWVRKGDAIGKALTVQAPVWFKQKDAFEAPQNIDPSAKKGDRNAAKGIYIDLTPKNMAPTLVDFTGGKKLTPNNYFLEEAAVDALVLMPDGKLKVLNSRDATDPKANADAKERHDRVIHNRDRINSMLHRGESEKKGPIGPGLPGPSPKGGAGGS